MDVSSGAAKKRYTLLLSELLLASAGVKVSRQK